MIKTFTGPMHSGKTAAMIATYKKIWNKDHILCFKPNRDTRDIGEIKSKDYDVTISSIGIDYFEDILHYIDDKTRTIFIDEVQLMEGNVNVLTYLSIIKDIDIYLGGLNMTSEQEPFLIMPYILAISDEVEVIKASCYDCGRDATHTYYEGNKVEKIKVGDEGYIPLCRRCLAKRRGLEDAKKLYLGIKKDTNFLN